MCATLEKETAMSKMLVTLFAGLFALSAFAVEAPKVAAPAAKTPAVAPAAVVGDVLQPVARPEVEASARLCALVVLVAVDDAIDVDDVTVREVAQRAGIPRGDARILR